MSTTEAEGYRQMGAAGEIESASESSDDLPAPLGLPDGVESRPTCWPGPRRDER